MGLRIEIVFLLGGIGPHESGVVARLRVVKNGVRGQTPQLSLNGISMGIRKRIARALASVNSKVTAAILFEADVVAKVPPGAQRPVTGRADAGVRSREIE